MNFLGNGAYFRDNAYFRGNKNLDYKSSIKSSSDFVK